MSKKASTTSQTVEIPPEVREQYKTLIARGNQITQKPFQAYSQDPTAFVAPLTSTQQSGIANINEMQGMAQPSVERGQNMIMEGIGAAAPLQYQSMDTAAQGREAGTALFGESLGTAASGTGAAGQIFGQALPAIQQAGQTGARYGAKADPYLSGALGAATPLMGEGADYTRAGLGAGAEFGAKSAGYLGGATRDVGPTDFSSAQIDKYMSPYLKDVVGAQQALQAEEAAGQRSALKGQAIAAGAFGGDRSGIAQANLARQQSLANQATLSNLLQGGYGQALGAFQQQQATKLGAEQANRAAQQFGSQQAAALGQQQFGQNLAAGSQLSNIGQQLFGQNITQGQALAGLGQQLFGQGVGGAQAAAGIGSNVASMKAQEAALQQQAAAGVFGQAAQQAALQQSASQNVFNMANQGGMNYANLGIAGQGAALQGAQAQLAAGQIEQQTEQAAKSAMYNQFLQQQGFPFQQLGFLGNLSTGVGQQSGGTTTTTQGSNSDRRLKEDIKQVGETFDGQPIYVYRFKGEEKSQLGLIAQEVEKTHPDAVGERNGYLTVDYYDATEDAAKRGHFATGGVVPSRLGGAVMEPGDYARGGYAGGGWTQTRGEEDANGQITPAQWTNSATGEVKYGSDPNVYETAAAEKAKETAASKIDPRIKELYQKNLFRDPDEGGAQYYQDKLDKGESIESIDADIGKSREKNLVNQTPLTYDPKNFGTPVTPVRNRYGSYSAPMSQSGSSFTAPAIAARQAATRMPTATGKGPAPGMPVQQPSSSMPTATGKGPASPAPQPVQPMPNATGKGPSSGASMPQMGTGQMGGSTSMAYSKQAGSDGDYRQSPPNRAMLEMEQAYEQQQQRSQPAQQQQQQFMAQPQASGKGPQPQRGPSPSYSPPPSMGYSSPTATGKGPAAGMPVQQPSRNAYSGTNSTGYSGSPTATGKGPAPAYASGGRVAYAGGGASSNALKDYIDMMSGSARSTAMAHKNIFSMPGERADITKYFQNQSGRSNVPQPGRIPEQRNMIKEAADTGTSVAKIFELGSKAKDKLGAMYTEYTTPKKEGSGAEVPKTTTAPQKSASLEGGGGKQEVAFDGRPDGDMLSDTRNSIANTFGGGGGGLDPQDVSYDVASLDAPSFEGFDFPDFSFANGGRIHKQFAGAVEGDEESSMDPSEGAYNAVGPELDIDYKDTTKGGGFAKEATQRLLKGGGSGGGGGGGGSLLGSVGQAVGMASSAFTIGKAIATFLPMILSDERMKKHIKPIGRLYDGQTVYRYDMGDETQIGLIAQEVEKEMPEAVGDTGKHKAVDYDMATAGAAKRGRFAFGGPTKNNDLSFDPVFDVIESAGRSPSDAMTISDASFKDEPAPEREEPVIVAGLNPNASDVSAPAPAPASAGLKPPDDRYADVYDKMLGNESGRQQFDKTGGVLRGKAGEEGISQIKPAAAKEAAASLGIEYNPELVRTDKNYNMKLGKAYFNMQLDKFNGDPMLAAAAYNAGPGRVSQALKMAEEKGGDFLDYLPQTTVRYLANLSDAAQGAHEKLMERQTAIQKKEAEGTGPKVVDAAQQVKGLAGSEPAKEPGLGAAIGPKRDWELMSSKILPDMVPKSADFWVPLIAAVGGMLGARSPTVGGAIGAGLTAGASAYMKREEFQQEALKNSLAMVEKRFLPIFGEGENKWLDTMTNRKLTDQQYASVISAFPGMPRIAPTMAEPDKGLGAAAAEKPKPKAEGLAPPAETVVPAAAVAPVVTPPKVKVPEVVAAGAETAAPKSADVNTNLRKLEIPTFSTQPEADAWVMENADQLYRGVDPSRDPRTYIKRAEQERAKETEIEKRISAISGDPRPAAKAQLEQLRTLQANAERERTSATNRANDLIVGTTALAMDRSKLQMQNVEALDKLKKEEDIKTGSKLRETQPRAGGPTILRTEKQILDEINRTGLASSDTPGAGNPVVGAPPAEVVSKQPEYLNEKLKKIVESELQMAENFKQRQPTKERFNNLIKIVEAYQTGAFAEFKQDAVRWARGLGFDVKDTDTANPEAFQVFRKNAITGIIDQAKSLAGPIALKELELIGKANVDTIMEPAAVASLLAEGKGLLDYEDKYYEDYASWRKDNKENAYPELDFGIGWVKANPTRNFVSEARKDIASLGERLPSKAADYKHGQKYIIRQGDSFGPAFWDVSRNVFTTVKPAPVRQ
jgi:hypothetical protein